MKRSELGFISVIVLFLLIIVPIVWIFVQTKIMYMESLVNDEINFIKMEYKAEKGILWALKKAKISNIADWPKQIELEEKNGVTTILIQQKQLEKTKIYELKSIAVSDNNTHQMGIRVGVEYKDNQQKPYEYMVNYIKPY